MGDSFFSNFPLTFYDPLDENRQQAVVDILRRFRIREDVKSNADFFVRYRVGDSERPDTISYKLYGNVSDWWIIMLMNDMQCLQYDWPLPNNVLDKYIDKKYPGEALFLWDTKRNQNFRVSETVTTGDSSIEVYDWNPTFNKLVFLDSTRIGKEIQTGEVVRSSETTMRGTVNRRVLFHRFALHHFATSSSLDTIHLDPWNSTTNYLRGYITESVDTNVVTNEQHEREVNEAKRDIVLLRPEFIQNVKEHAKIIFRGESRLSNSESLLIGRN